MVHKFCCGAFTVLVYGTLLKTSSSKNNIESEFHRFLRQIPPEQIAGDERCVMPLPLENGRFSNHKNRCPSYVSNPVCKMTPGAAVPKNWPLYIACDRGYRLTISKRTVSICVGGHWRPELPACVASERCPALRIPNVNVKCTLDGSEVSCDQETIPGTVATAECQEKYKPTFQTQSASLLCLESGLWNSTFACNKVSKLCPALKPANAYVTCTLNGRVVSCDQEMEPDTIAKAECEEKYEQHFKTLSPGMLCLESGSWSSEFHCIKEVDDSFSCPTGVNGSLTRHAHPEDCRQYYICLEGQAREYSCPLGTVFQIGETDGNGNCEDPKDVLGCDEYYGDLPVGTTRKSTFT